MKKGILFHKILYLYYALSPQVEHFYYFFPKEKLFGKKSFFINFGYWPGCKDYDEAAKNLALALSNYAQLKPNQIVVTAGCGYGDELALWGRTYSLEKIIGLNINATQLQCAQEMHIEPVISFCQTNATHLSFQKNSIDRVLALESAFHFNSRADFFNEAIQVLKPRAVLGLTDIILKDENINWLQKALLSLACRVSKIPRTNWYGWDQYRACLEKAGFTEIEKKDISRQTIMGFASYFYKTKGLKQSIIKMGLLLISPIFAGKSPLIYILVRGVKP